MKAVYLIAFLNFKLGDISDRFRTDVCLMDMDRKVPFTDKERMIFLQLPYFTKEADDCETIFEKIIYVLKHMDVLERMPWMAKEAVFQKLANIADVASLSKQERQAYDENLRKYRDTVAVMLGQWEEGHAKGMEEGIEKGIEKGRAEIALTMKQSGMPINDIVKFTGLTEKEIAEL